MNKTFLCLVLLLSSAGAYATPSILSTWQGINTSSDSDNVAGCQMCHQRSGGGNGWNAYGWEIRQSLPGVSSAINAAASVDSDGDGHSNLVEIQSNNQPGWRDGANNTIHCSVASSYNPCDGNNTQLVNQRPPDFSSLIPSSFVRFAPRVVRVITRIAQPPMALRMIHGATLSRLSTAGRL